MHTTPRKRLSKNEKEEAYKIIMDMWKNCKREPEMRETLNIHEDRFDGLYKDFWKLLRRRMVRLFVQGKTQQQVMEEMEISENQFWCIWGDCFYKNEFKWYEVTIMPEDAQFLPFDKWNMVKHSRNKYGTRLVTNGKVLKALCFREVPFYGYEEERYRHHWS